MRANNLGFRKKAEEPERNPWKRFLLAGALALSAISITRAQHCDSCNPERRNTPVASKITVTPKERTDRAKKERLAAWARSVRKKALSWQPILPPDPLEAMIERDFPYDSLNCEITTKPRKKDPACDGDWFVRAMCEADNAMVEPYEFKFVMKGPEELFQDACPEGKACEPLLIEELDRLVLLEDNPGLIHFINSVNRLGIEWSENGAPGGLLDAHFASLIEAHRDGMETEADEKCVARLFYASRLISSAREALIDLALESPASLAGVISELDDDSRPSFFYSLALSALVEEGQADTIRRVFASMPENAKLTFLDAVRDLSASDDPFLREAAGALLKNITGSGGYDIPVSD